MQTIGKLELKTPFLLAPLAGVTDAPFRRLCSEQGASMVYTEMVSAKGLWYKDKNTDRLLKMYDDEKPVAFQLFGNDPEIMAYAAEALDERENAVFDINMGCPVPKVVKNGEGSALLKDPDLAAKIVEAVVSKTKKPVTAKIRIGWDKNSLNAVEMGKSLENAGISAIAVHGRTREMYYTGHADWDEITKVKRALKIPVIGNGDVFNGEDANNLLRHTGCDYVMIARGAMGNPWIFRDAIAVWEGKEAIGRPEKEEIIKTMLKHFDLLIAEKGDYIAVREMRKHIGWYLKGQHNVSHFKDKINKIENVTELKEALISF